MSYPRKQPAYNGLTLGSRRTQDLRLWTLAATRGTMADMTLTTIVSGIDPSPLAHSALRWSRDLATGTNATLRVVGVWQMPLIGLVPLPLDGLPTPEFMADQCNTMIQSTIQETGTAPEEVLCLEGKPGPTLVGASTDASLLVVGRTGQGKRHGLARFAEVMLGSTARHCVHHSDSPVATVPADAQWPQSKPVAVVGLDGSPNSVHALEWTLASLPADTTLHIVRAFAPWLGDGLTPLDVVDDTSLVDTFQVETTGWVDAAVSRVGAQLTHDPEVHVSIGSGIDALLGSGLQPDVIVVGERGHTGISAKVLGSVADHVVRYAPCPVIVVPLTATA